MSGFPTCDCDRRRALAWSIILAATIAAAGCGGDTQQASAPHRLDPARVRPEIQAIETRLYSDATPGVDEFDRLENLIVVLGTRVLRDVRDPRATVAGQRLFDLAGEIGGRSDVGYAVPDMPALRRRWETVRDDVFQPAGWFRHAETARAAQ